MLGQGSLLTLPTVQSLWVSARCACTPCRANRVEMLRTRDKRTAAQHHKFSFSPARYMQIDLAVPIAASNDRIKGAVAGEDRC